MGGAWISKGKENRGDLLARLGVGRHGILRDQVEDGLKGKCAEKDD